MMADLAWQSWEQLVRVKLRILRMVLSAIDLSFNIRFNAIGQKLPKDKDNIFEQKILLMLEVQYWDDGSCSIEFCRRLR